MEKKEKKKSKVAGILGGIAIFALIFLFMFLSENASKSNSHSRDEIYQLVTDGMTREQVKDIAGSPDDIAYVSIEGYDGETWRYGNYKDILIITFVNGKVSSKALA